MNAIAMKLAGAAEGMKLDGYGAFVPVEMTAREYEALCLEGKKSGSTHSINTLFAEIKDNLFKSDHASPDEASTRWHDLEIALRSAFRPYYPQVQTVIDPTGRKTVYLLGRVDGEVPDGFGYVGIKAEQS